MSFGMKLGGFITIAFALLINGALGLSVNAHVAPEIYCSDCPDALLNTLPVLITANV